MLDFQLFSSDLLRSSFTLGVCRLSAAVLIGLSAAPVAAADFELADGRIQGQWNTRVVAGTSVRTGEAQPHLLGKGFASDGRPKGGTGADTADDGNLNFQRGDAFSSLFKMVQSVDLKYRDVGVNLSARTWYDATLDRKEVAQGNVPNGFDPDSPLGDGGFSRSNKFSGFLWLNAYVYGHLKLDEDSALDVRVGKQSVKWGNGLFFSGVNQANPIDYTTLRRPGTDAASEAQIPVEMLWAKWTLDSKLSLEGFWQWNWRPSEYDPCGTFFSGSDLGIERGCAGIQSNAYYPINSASADAGPWLSDGFMQSMGAILPRDRDRYGSDSGQWGLSLRYRDEQRGLGWAAYYLRINSRAPYLDATVIDPARTDPTLAPRLIAAGVPQAYAQLSARLSTIREIWEYPDDIRIFGLSLDARWKGWKLGTELSYTQDQPVQLNTADMFRALTSNGGPIGQRNAALAPGDVLRGFDRVDKTQWIVNAQRSFADVFGARQATLTAEASYSHADLPPLSQARYGRGFHWGFSPQGYGGVCPPVQNPRGCVDEGFYTRNAWGYRLRAQLDYAPGGEWTLSPSLSFGHDVRGFAIDNQLVEDRRQLTLALSAKYGKHYFASLSYTDYAGSARYDPLADHDFASVAVGATF
ncbi:DUF1302 domain-containing protein [Pseudomonas sp. CGJS7]|uniref:DUF1302 domain-containing protein n=1 Tax=Pseudomonas sp. CGJS7 TaxID=3109348 RepID=UPI00300A1552